MKNVRFFCALILGSICTAVASAADIHLYAWTPPTGIIAPLILPVKSGESPEAAAERYLQNLERNPDLMELFSGQRPATATGKFELLKGDRESRALLIANLPKDYGPDSARVNNFKKLFARNGHQSFILPMNANLGLTQNETRTLFDKISANFPLMVPMGGDDVEPSLYKKDNYHSRNTIPARDQFEIALIKNYVASERGFILAVCRGSQITSVALGYKLLQDVPIQVGPKLPHAEDWHDIEVKKTSHGILASLLPADSNKLFVNSLHHQAVQFRPGGMLELAATAADGVTEATEFKNGRGILLQFHPEFMENELGFRIVKKAVEQKLQVMPRSCSKVFQH
ncbi:gamma-glutamyl-gamma-aminobutyrate hydrolase family protein [Bdellovibrio sp. HCB274]|uniref:gamma-glutamyl-gamma-aminobutyrate hydrolase family protein n=1 Tax=Bdellovibrio sp. HCB274 TaxID=3394361 RepID=UPI0039B62A8C